MPAVPPLQLEWFVDPRPASLPLWLLVLGVEVLVLGAALRYVRSLGSSRALALGGLCLGTGYFLLSLRALAEWPGLYAAYLFVLFRAVEGAASARFYRKVAYALRNRSLLAGSRTRGRIEHGLFAFFVVVAGAGMVLHRLRTPSPAPWYPTAVGIYTIALTAITALGVWWRVKPLAKEYEVVTLLGFVACVTGAEIYAYSSLSTEVLVAAGGAVAYGAGFWLLVGAWSLGLLTPASPSSP